MQRHALVRRILVRRILFDLGVVIFFFISSSETGERGLCGGLRFKRCAGCGFGSSKSGACFFGLHFAVARRLGKARCYARCGLCRTIAHGALLSGTGILFYDRYAATALVLFEAPIHFLLPRWLGYGLCTQFSVPF
jgi:hypothetical protein